MELLGRIFSVVDNIVTFVVDNPEQLDNLGRITEDKHPEAMLKVPDGRKISPIQRNKAYAIMQDMSKSSGIPLEEIKKMMKKYYAIEMHDSEFSLANTDVTTASQFISFLIDWCFQYDISLSKPAIKYHADEDRYQYMCLKYRKCVLCNQHADIHHADKVGLNMRHLADHREKRLVALCRIHHQQAENMGWPGFSELYAIPGYKLDERTLNELKIMTYASMREKDRRKARDDQSSRISRTNHQGR